jgi:membrane protease YdiL (CAAX protease family)
MVEIRGEQMENMTGGRGRALSRWSQFLEVSVLVLLILPSTVVSHFAIKQPGFGFVPAAIGTILHNVAFLCLIAFFVWKNGESWKSFGLRGDHAGREVVAGILLFVLMSIAVNLLAKLLSSAGISLPGGDAPSFLTPGSRAAYVLALFLVVLVSISEEVIFRGYLIVRLVAVSRSRLLAVLLSTLIFASGHGYQGASGVAAVFMIGLVLSCVYLWRKSLVAPIVMHFMQDFLGIFVFPLLHQGH